MGSRLQSVVITVVTALFSVAAAQATGAVSGQVQDAQGKPLPGIKVTLLHAGQSETREQTSDAEGKFTFADLTGGVYTTAVTSEGYAPVTCPGVRVRDLPRNVEMKLTPAAPALAEGEIEPAPSEQSSCRIVPLG